MSSVLLRALLIHACSAALLYETASAAAPPPYSLIDVPATFLSPRPPPITGVPPRPPPYPTDTDNITCFTSDFPFAAGIDQAPNYFDYAAYTKCFAFHFSVTLYIEATTFSGTNTYYGGESAPSNWTCDDILSYYYELTRAVSPPGYVYTMLPDPMCCDTWACNSVDAFPNTVTLPNTGALRRLAPCWVLLAAVLAVLILNAAS